MKKRKGATKIEPKNQNENFTSKKGLMKETIAKMESSKGRQKETNLKDGFLGKEQSKNVS